MNPSLRCEPSTRGVLSTEDPFSAQNNGGASFQMFFPSSCARGNLNNHSVVTVIAYAGLKMLIPGDNEPCSWTELLERLEFVQAIERTTVLLAPHHGR